VDHERQLIAEFEGRTVGSEDASTSEHHAALWELEDATERAQAPMLRIEHALHPWVSFLIVPLFALANSGVRLDVDIASTVQQPITLGVILGLHHREAGRHHAGGGRGRAPRARVTS
jgi:NhaA family Na+:H+ antiporter